MDNKLEQNKALVKEFLLALYDLRVDDARQMMVSDCMFQIPNITMRPDTFIGEEMLNFLLMLKSALPEGFRAEFVEQTAEDNRVSTMVNGFAKTCDGTDYNNRYHFLHVVEDGKIVKHYEYIDSYLAAKVMGPILKRLMSGEK